MVRFIFNTGALPGMPFCLPKAAQHQLSNQDSRGAVATSWPWLLPGFSVCCVCQPSMGWGEWQSLFQSPWPQSRMGFVHHHPKDPVLGLVCLVTGINKNYYYREKHFVQLSIHHQIDCWHPNFQVSHVTSLLCEDEDIFYLEMFVWCLSSSFNLSCIIEDH